MLIGTNTDGQHQNYVQIATVEVPDLEKACANASEYNENLKEIGGHGAAKRPFVFNITQKINHPSEVNKARYNPLNPNLIAAWCVDGRVLLYDRTKHTNQPKADGTVTFEMELKGHTDEGFGLCWSPHKSREGELLTGSQDNTVRRW